MQSCLLISKYWNVLSPLFPATPVSTVVSSEQHIQFTLLNSIKSLQNRHDVYFRWITDKCKLREITFCSFSEPVLLAGWPPPNLTRTSKCCKSLGTKPWAHSSVGLCYASLPWKTMLKKSSATRPSRAASHLPEFSKNTLTPQILHLIYASSQRWLHQTQPLQSRPKEPAKYWANQPAWRTKFLSSTTLPERRQAFARAQTDTGVPSLEFSFIVKKNSLSLYAWPFPVLFQVSTNDIHLHDMRDTNSLSFKDGEKGLKINR